MSLQDIKNANIAKRTHSFTKYINGEGNVVRFVITLNAPPSVGNVCSCHCNARLDKTNIQEPFTRETYLQLEITFIHVKLTCKLTSSIKSF